MGFCALVAIALGNIANAAAVVLMVPLAIDCGFALSDNTQRQAIHDRIARTMIVSTRRATLLIKSSDYLPSFAVV